MKCEGLGISSFGRGLMVKKFGATCPVAGKWLETVVKLLLAFSVLLLVMVLVMVSG